MSLTRTATFMNWVDVTWLNQNVTNAQATQIISVTNVKPKRKNKIESFFGDAAAGARVKAAVEQERGISITSGDVASLMAIPTGVPLTITATLLDPYNKAQPGGGAIKITLVNAILADDDSSGENNRFANGTVTFESFWSVGQDGFLVDPLSVTPL